MTYLVHFFGRKRLGGTNLFVPGVIVTVAFFTPLAWSYLDGRSRPFELPTVTSPEVKAVVQRIVDTVPGFQAARDNLGPIRVAGVAEDRFDEKLQQRQGRATLMAREERQPIVIHVNWQDRAKGMWQVQVIPVMPKE